MLPGALVHEWDYRVEAGKIREFALAVHDPHPESDLAPPTFPMAISAEIIERTITSLGLDRSRTVHGEQRYLYERPIRAGDLLHCRARVIGDTTKAGRRGGTMRFVTIEVELSEAADGRLVCRETMVAIEREAANR